MSVPLPPINFAGSSSASGWQDGQFSTGGVSFGYSRPPLYLDVALIGAVVAAVYLVTKRRR